MQRLWGGWTTQPQTFGGAQELLGSGFTLSRCMHGLVCALWGIPVLQENFVTFV
jgi:hypothetical protein